MKRYLIQLSLVCTFFIAQAQNQQSYFKVYQSPSIEQPDWAQLMYSENPNIDEVIYLYHKFYNTHEFKKTIHIQNFKYWLKQIVDIVDENGLIQDPYSETFTRKLQTAKAKKLSANFRAGNWTTAGPFNTYLNNGSLDTRPTQTNVYAIAVAPSNHDILYCFTEGGGVFKSINHADNWFLVSKNETFTSGADIKVDPSNPDIVYVGTGKNVFKTTNSGQNWDHIFTAPGKIEQFLIHPTQNNKIYAATSDGLFYSSTSGTTWTNILDKKCWDIEMKPDNPSVMYVSVYNKNQKRAEIFKTVNGLSNWTLMDNGWYVPTTFADASAIGCKIGVSPADPDRVYACLIGNSKVNDNGWIGVYYSLNGGTSWVNPDGIDGGPYESGDDKNTNWYYAGYSNGYHQGWYNFDMDVSHSDPDRIWIGTIWACESENRGENIEYIRGTRSLEMHADIQDIDVVGDDIWYVSDGGINYSNDEMQTVEVKNNGIHASNFWGFSQGWNVDTWTGGRYHNGDAVYHANYGLGNTVFQGGAESATGYIDPFNNLVCRYSDISDKITPNSLTQPARNHPNLGLYPNQSYWVLNSSEIEYDPRYSDHIYLGNGNVLYKSTNGGGLFEPLFSFPEDARVLEFEISRSNPNIIYCLITNPNGEIYKSLDGGHTFVKIADIPSNRSKLDLSLNPEDSDNLWVISNRGSNGNKVYQTIDGGNTWINMTSSILDDHSLLDVAYQYGTDKVVYISTNLGLFYWDNGTSEWIDYSNGLPLMTRTLKMIPFYRDGKIRMASGRGIWESPLAKPSMPLAQPFTKRPDIFCSRDTVQLEDYSVLNHENATWNWSFSPTPIYVDDINIRNPKVVFGENGYYDVTLTITDGNGNTSTKTILQMINVDNQCEKDPIPGQALLLSESGDYGNIPDLNISQTNNLTFSAWVKPNGIQPSYSGIVFNDSDKAGLNFIANNHLGYHWPGGQWWWDSGLEVPEGEWSHVALVATPTSITIYLNGESSTQNINIDPIDLNTMKIGSYRGWDSRNYKGEIDEVCIWNRSLSSDEIRSTRHLTRTGVTPYTNDLVAYYQFNTTQSSLILDKIGIHHAQLNSGATKTLSTVPVGTGTTQKMTISNSGNYNFQTTGVDIEFGNMNPEGDVFVTRLEILPDSISNENPHTGDYWIVNNYGNNQNVDINSISFKPKDGSPAGLAENVGLLQRADNEFINNWDILCNATNLTENFEFNNCEISNLSQFFIQSNTNDEIINQIVITNQEITICENESAFLEGAEQNQTGIYTDTITIDSVVITNLLVNPIFYQQIEESICQGELISFNGTDYSESGTYTDTLSTQHGCDSINSLILIVLSTQNEQQEISLCEGESIVINNETITESGTYSETFLNTNGCDSIITTVVQFNSNQAGTVTYELCQGESIIINNETITESGTYSVAFLNTNGCDSIVNIVVQFNSAQTENFTYELCQGESISFGGITYSMPGIYTDSLQTTNGCDSLIIYNLNFNDNITTNSTIELCEGESVFLAGEERFVSGTYIDSLQSVNGCDSIISTQLIVSTINVDNQFVNICEGESVFLQGQNQMESGIYYDTIQVVNCYSITKTNLTVIPNITIELDQNLCQGDTLWIKNTPYFENGLVIDSLQNVNGCDSIVNYNIILEDTYFQTENVTICKGESIFIAGEEHTDGGVFTNVFQSTTGCDSTIETTLIILPTSLNLIIIESCAGDSISIDGNKYFGNTIILDTLSNVNGCDSIISRELVFHPLPDVHLEAFAFDTICHNGGNINLPEGTPTEGIYTLNGDQIDELNPIHLMGLQEIVYSYANDFTGCDGTDTSNIYVMICLANDDITTQLGLKLYPNPNDGLFSIEKMHAFTKPIQIEIVDASSKSIYKTSVHQKDDKVEIDIREYSAGVYYLILDVDGERYTKQIIRQ